MRSSYFYLTYFCFVILADIETWSEQNKDESKSMKASSFANEDPVPFNPSLIDGIDACQLFIYI